MKENGEEPNEKSDGVGNVLLSRLSYSASIDTEILFDFAENYGVSIDYLLGRTEKYWL